MSRISRAIRSDRRAFAIFLAMLLTILIVLMGVYLIDKLVPASRDVKGVENGNVAYYKASSAIELALLSLSGANPGTETGSTAGNLVSSGYALSTVGSGTVVPKPGLGNSEFDTDWNVLTSGKPIQIKLPVAFKPSDLAFEFRVPDLNRNGATGEDGGGDSATESLSGGSAQTINWIITGSGDSLVAAASQVLTANQVNQTASASLATLTGSNLSNTGLTVSAFGTANCAPPVRCSIKFSIIRALETKSSVAVPYLEYRITSINGAGPIPQQWTRITSEGYSRGFKQSRVRNVEQTTVGEALDFTVFQ